MYNLRRSLRAQLLSKHSAVSILLIVVLLVPNPCAAQLRGSVVDEDVGKAPLSPSLSFQIKPVEGAPTAPGVRRVIQTFGDWTLICDEAKRGRVCNASQSIVAEDGMLAFSWSMAATVGGEPVFLLRAPVAEFPAHTVTLSFGTTETVVRLERCDTRLCIGFLPLNSLMVRQIKDRGQVTIRYRIAEGLEPVTFVAPLDGLRKAIGSIH